MTEQRSSFSQAQGQPQPAQQPQAPFSQQPAQPAPPSEDAMSDFDWSLNPDSDLRFALGLVALVAMFAMAYYGTRRTR